MKLQRIVRLERCQASDMDVSALTLAELETMRRMAGEQWPDLSELTDAELEAILHGREHTSYEAD